MRTALAFSSALVLLLTACSGPSRQSKTYGSGEKATVDQLTYNVVDSEFHTRLGDDANPRNPQNRFAVVQIAVSNAGNADAPIPGLALVDDSGKVYRELADGTGVPQWLGVIRKVGPGQTERGSVLFDAPSGHYKLKLTDDSDQADVYADIPLTFIHEQLNQNTPSMPGTPAATIEKK